MKHALSPKTIFSRIIIYSFLILLAFFFLAPVYAMVVSSLKPFAEVSVFTMWELPKSLHLSNFTEAFETLKPHFGNSIYLVIPATILSAFIGSINGYVFSKWKFKYSKFLFWLIVMGMFLPFQSILLPMVQVLQKLRVYNTIPGLILVHVVYGIPITTLMFKNFYTSTPQAMIESAKIDRAGFWRIYIHIVFPLSLPAFMVVFIWQFTNIWNEFLFAIIVTSAGKQPIMVALQNMSGSQVVEWNVTMAGALIAAAPTALVYLVAGKYFVKGLLAGSIKE